MFVLDECQQKKPGESRDGTVVRALASQQQNNSIQFQFDLEGVTNQCSALNTLKLKSSDLFYFILFYFILFYFILFYFILFYFILFYFILFYFILFYFILFYFILFYFILFYFILFYFILFYFIYQRLIYIYTDINTWFKFGPWM